MLIRHLQPSPSVETLRTILRCGSDKPRLHTARFQRFLLHCWLVFSVLGLALGAVAAQTAPLSVKPIAITIDWAVMQPMRTTPTLQVVVNPLLRRGSPIHDAVFSALQQLGADYVRYVPWHPYPKLAVAELEPPANGHTSWDFNLIDPMTLDFFHATEGHSTILNFCTNPAWLYATEKPVSYPADPDTVDWSYTQGKELRDPTCSELAAYDERLVGWYTQGGFTDEAGKRHESGYHFKIPYWEVSNEIDVEHQPTPQQYTACYDAVVSALHKLDPGMKFVGLALAFPERNPNMVEYFLDHSHHRPDIPLDMISYHFYATPTLQQGPDHWQYSFFDQADRLIASMRYIEAVRKRLSPETRTTVDEIGSILPTDWHPDTPYDPGPPIPRIYWNASGALFAYFFIESSKLGINVTGESQLVGFPSQFPSVTMVDWNTDKPNARFEVLRLLHDYTHSGDQIAQTRFTGSDIDALALASNKDKRLLLVNKRNREVPVALPKDFQYADLASVAESTNGSSSVVPWNDSVLTLPPFAVVLLTESPTKPAQQGSSCAELTKLKLENVEIVSAKAVPAGPGNARVNSTQAYANALPAYCRVDGMIARRKGRCRRGVWYRLWRWRT